MNTKYKKDEHEVAELESRLLEIADITTQSSSSTTRSDDKKSDHFQHQEALQSDEKQYNEAEVINMIGRSPIHTVRQIRSFFRCMMSILRSYQLMTDNKNDNNNNNLRNEMLLRSSNNDIIVEDDDERVVDDSSMFVFSLFI